MGEPHRSAALEGLPPKFVSSIRTLFELLDDRHQGFVAFSDVERLWKEGEVPGMPPSVIESLKRVTPTSGLLSFERFCAGLKIWLLRQRASSKVPRPLSAPNLLKEVIRPVHNTATVRPVVAHQRAMSVPLPDLHIPVSENDQRNCGTSGFGPAGPPKPPRSSHSVLPGLERGQGEDVAQPATVPPAGAAPVSRDHVRMALYQWQIRNAATENEAPKKSTMKRRDSRRHTLQNGVDNGLLRRVEVIEKERQAVKSGLETVEKTRLYFQRQLMELHEQIRALGQSQALEPLSEAQRERLDFKISRIEDVTRQLNMICDHQFPAHFNLAMRSSMPPPRNSGEAARVIERLKEQNHQLTEEVSRKSEVVTLLQQEKAALIRDLLQSKSNPHLPRKGDDNTFM